MTVEPSDIPNYSGVPGSHCPYLVGPIRKCREQTQQGLLGLCFSQAELLF